MLASTIWAWIGVGFFAFGSLVFVPFGIGGAERDRRYSVTSLVVTLIATFSYLSLALHRGVFAAGQAEPFGYGRFVGWTLTTPLLLMELAALALPWFGKRPALVAGLIVSDVFMIVMGLLAGFSAAGSGVKWIWYVASCGAFLVLYFLIWGPLRSAAIEQRSRSEKLLVSSNPDERYEGARYKGETGLFYQQAGLLSMLWLFYPIAFLVSAQGLDLVPLSYTSASYTVLDVLSKVGFGLLLLTGVRSIERDSKETAGQRTRNSRIPGEPPTWSRQTR